MWSCVTFCRIAEGEVVQQLVLYPSVSVQVTMVKMVPRRHQVRLTPRDLEISRDLWLYRYLTTHQVSRLHFGHLKLAQRRMRQLVRARLVDRFSAVPSESAGFEGWTYRLSGEGVKLIAADTGLAPEEVRPPIRPPHGVGYLAHHRILTDFRIWLREGCAGAAGGFGYQFVPSYEEIRVAGRRQRRVSIEVAGRKRRLVPDGAFALVRSADAKAALFLLEIDRGTEPLSGVHPSSIEKKLGLYLDAFEHEGEGAYGRLFDRAFNGFRVLFLVPDRKRASGVVGVAQRMDLQPIVWVAEADMVRRSGDLTARVWLDDPKGPLRSLVE